LLCYPLNVPPSLFCHAMNKLHRHRLRCFFAFILIPFLSRASGTDKQVFEDVHNFTLKDRDGNDLSKLLHLLPLHRSSDSDSGASRFGWNAPVQLAFSVAGWHVSETLLDAPSPIAGLKVSVWNDGAWIDRDKEVSPSSQRVLRSASGRAVLSMEGPQRLSGLLRSRTVSGEFLELSLGPFPEPLRVAIHGKPASVPSPSSDRSPGGGTTARELRMAPDEIDQWTDCYEGEDVTKQLKIGIVIASNLYERLGTDVDNCGFFLASVFSKINLIYQAQLNVVLTVERLGVVAAHDSSAPRYDQGPTCSMNMTMQLAWFSVSELPYTGIWHLMDDCFPGSGVVGLAYTASICQNDKEQGFSWNRGVTWYSTSTWLTTAHEIGHNFGAFHSFEDGQGVTGGIMDYGDGTLDGIYQFNDYRKDEMCAEIERTVKNCSYWADLEETCGDGFVDPSEECECASFETSCLYCENCKLTGDKECSPEGVLGGECCTDEGYFHLPSQVCYTHDCTVGYCSLGYCEIAFRCAYSNDILGDYVGPSSANSCRYVCESSGDPLLDASGNVLNNFPDGTPCGDGLGTCEDGVCQDGTVVQAYSLDYVPTFVKHEAKNTVEGCVGYGNASFADAPDIFLARRNGGYSFEECKSACQQASQCETFVHLELSQECQLWTIRKHSGDLVTEANADTYFCNGWATAPDCEEWSGMRPGRKAIGGGQQLECQTCEEKTLTLGYCDRLCQEHADCHGFVFGHLPSKPGHCELWDGKTTLRDLATSTEISSLSTFICPCRGEGHSCACPRSRTLALKYDCRCDRNGTENDCSTGQYCWSDGTCHSSSRRLTDCETQVGTTTTRTTTKKVITSTTIGDDDEDSVKDLDAAHQPLLPMSSGLLVTAALWLHLFASVFP